MDPGSCFRERLPFSKRQLSNGELETGQKKSDAERIERAGGMCGHHEPFVSASLLLTPFFRPPALCTVRASASLAQLFAIVPIGGSRGNVLELAPWTWKGGRAVDPGIYNNVFDDLDTSPVSAHDAACASNATKSGLGIIVSGVWGLSAVQAGALPSLCSVQCRCGGSSLGGGLMRTAE